MADHGILEIGLFTPSNVPTTPTVASQKASNIHRHEPMFLRLYDLVSCLPGDSNEDVDDGEGGDTAQPPSPSQTSSYLNPDSNPGLNPLKVVDTDDPPDMSVSSKDMDTAAHMLGDSSGRFVVTEETSTSSMAHHSISCESLASQSDLTSDAYLSWEEITSRVPPTIAEEEFKKWFLRTSTTIVTLRENAARNEDTTCIEGVSNVEASDRHIPSIFHDTVEDIDRRNVVKSTGDPIEIDVELGFTEDQGNLKSDGYGEGKDNI
jgi:hypothetical protein